MLLSFQTNLSILQIAFPFQTQVQYRVSGFWFHTIQLGELEILQLKTFFQFWIVLSDNQNNHDGDKHNIRVEGGLSKNPTSGDFGFMCSDNEQYIASDHIAQLKKHLAVWRHVKNLTK